MFFITIIFYKNILMLLITSTITIENSFACMKILGGSVFFYFLKMFMAFPEGRAFHCNLFLAKRISILISNAKA